MSDGGTPVLVQGVLALDEWEHPIPRSSGPSAAPVLDIGNFEGPLDWLLELARSRRIDLVRLSITALVDAFEAALTNALGAADKEPMVLARWSGWLVMAAELTLLRSRLLLPADARDARAAHGEAERLRRTLLARAAAARAAEWLDGRTQLGRDVFPRGGTDADGAVHRQRTGDITALLRACLVALKLPSEAEARFRPPGPPFWSVAEATKQIRAMLPAPGEAGLQLNAFLPGVAADATDRDRRCRTALAATFLASLELTKGGETSLGQDQAWQTITVSASTKTEACHT